MHTFNLQRPCTFLQGPSHRCALAFYHLWSNVLAWYARETESRYKADTRNNEDGNGTRNVCVNSVVCLPKFCSVKYQVHHSHVSNKMTIALLTASVDMPGNLQGGSQFRFNFPAHITNIFLATITWSLSRRGGVSLCRRTTAC